MPLRLALFVLLVASAARASDLTTTTVEWISLSGESQALWVEGTAPDGPLTLELHVADDTLILATRETIASNGRFSSLLRPRRLPKAAYSLEIAAGRAAARVPVFFGTEEERDAYSQPETAWMGGAYDRIVSLTDELHRFRDDCSTARDFERWHLWSPGWETRRQALSHELDEFRAGRGVLGKAREFYRLVSSLCFAKTLHALYSAELDSRGGGPGGGEASDWSLALAEQLDEFKEARMPVTPEQIAGWAAELGADDAVVRDRATRGLAHAGSAARLALLEITLCADPEAVARARELLDRLK